MNKPLHPGAALFKGEKPFPIIPSCEHYAGSEKLMLRALALQDSIGPVFDLTRDCLNILVSGAGDLPWHITLPKATSSRQVAEAITCIQRVAAQQRIKREIPVNAIIETHGTLRYVWDIAALPWMQSLAFGLMDFVSDHHGTLGAAFICRGGDNERPDKAQAFDLR